VNARDDNGLRVGFSTPRDFWELSPRARHSRLARAADAGLDHVFCADHVSFQGGHGADGIVHMAAMAAAEPRLAVEVGVFLLALRHPMVAARQIASLAQTAPGRVTIGVGVGGEDRHEIEVCEIDPTTRGRRTDVAIDLVRRLLAGETVDGDGGFYAFAGGRIRPVPDPPVPVVVGGRSDAAVRRAGRHGDGWLAAWCSPRRFAEGVALAEAVGAEAGRTGVRWRHGLQLWLGIGRDPDDGRRHVGPAMESFYGIPFEAFARYTPCGTPDQIAEQLEPYVRAGARALNLTAVGADPDGDIEAVAAIKEAIGS
jgi:alkanesulfonate monooxygenase SsuD/methylene tetrahydromethanopterin reductase-like flavin-dependent oxidoreductase (luciferase family)